MKTGISAIERSEAPTGLTDEQAIEWRSVVNRMPAEWFPRETHALLIQFCRHVVSARRIAELIENLFSSDDFSLETFDQLLRMQERESRVMSSLATKMRLSQQSRFSHRKRTGPRIPAPWQH
jgi:hypothetical protein